MTDINGLLLTNGGFHNIRFADGGGQVPGRVINDAGQIAAIGEINGLTHAALLTPVIGRASVVRTGNGIVVRFVAVAGKSYRLEETASLTSPIWQSVPGVSDFTAPSTGPAQFTDINGTASDKLFYRVKLL